MNIIQLLPLVSFAVLAGVILKQYYTIRKQKEVIALLNADLMGDIERMSKSITYMFKEMKATTEKKPVAKRTKKVV